MSVTFKLMGKSALPPAKDSAFEWWSTNKIWLELGASFDTGLLLAAFDYDWVNDPCPA